jgi:23S rRNA pseudouridine1911/1915/1917 synthase
MPAPTRVTFKVTDEDVGRRLDQVLAAHVPGLSRRQARVLLDIGGVFVDKRRIKIAGRAMHAGEEVVAVLGGALARASGRTGTSAREGDERRLPAYAVVFEDEELVVVDKPAGLLTAPTPESDRNNLADLLARREGARGEIFVVHRIDLETSGLLVLAKTPDANRALSARFREHDIERVYLTVVAGPFPSDVATIDQAIAGRRAVTHVEVRERLAVGATLLACRLETGRTHQIRIHLSGLGHPVIGDARYGRAWGPAPPRMALHATTLGFAHPVDGRALTFTSPWPADLAPWLAGLRNNPTP